MHVQRHIRVLLDERADDPRQGIARLGVRGSDAQRALLFVGELLRDLLDAFALAQNFASRGDDALASGRDSGQMLAAAGENLDAQLVFEQADLFADTRL